MNASKAYSSLITAIGAAGFGILGAAAYFLTRDNEARDELAWEGYARKTGLSNDVSAFGVTKMLTAKAAYLAGRKATRTDEGNLRATTRRYEAILAGAENLVRISEGIKASKKLAHDSSVAPEVRGAIELHWVEQYSNLFGLEFDKSSRRTVYLALVDACRGYDAGRPA